MFAHTVRRKLQVPSGSAAGGRPCRDPSGGTARGALGRARPRWVHLSGPRVSCGRLGASTVIDSA